MRIQIESVYTSWIRNNWQKKIHINYMSFLLTLERLVVRKTYSGSRIQGSKRHRIPDPDPQHCHKSEDFCSPWSAWW
jgi:hypothetical protein